MIVTQGRAHEAPGGVMVTTTRPGVPNLSDAVEVLWHDVRMISPEQRRKAYALMGEIAVWSGSTPQDVKAAMKVDFRAHCMEALQKQLFSLSDCDMTTARAFISYLIDFMLDNDVPSSRPLAEYADDLERYVYSCLLHRKCAVCGRHAELHHVDRVGMGRDRREICHIGMAALPLCRAHHTEAHQHGDRALMEKYHLATVTIDERIAKANGLKNGGEKNGNEDFDGTPYSDRRNAGDGLGEP